LCAFSAAATLAWATGGVLADEIVNPLSAFEITVDGQFSPSTEWSDVTPLAFIAPPDNSGTLLRTTLDDPNANSHLYAAVAPGAVAEGPELYLMYDYSDRTSLDFGFGEFVADIVFPATVDGAEHMITVQIRGAAAATSVESKGGVSATIEPLVDSFFDIFVEYAGQPAPSPRLAELYGIEGAVGLGSSPLSSAPHLLIELEVPLLITSTFGVFEPSDGIYSPAPAFWGASAANDAVDPPISAAIFTINPNGSTTINNNFVTAAIPLPAAVWAGGALLGCVAVRRVMRRVSMR
jgi:hypothetical protein